MYCCLPILLQLRIKIWLNTRVKHLANCFRCAGVTSLTEEESGTQLWVTILSFMTIRFSGNIC